MGEDRSFWIATVVVGCLFLFIGANLFLLTWFALDRDLVGETMQTGVRTILDLGDKSKFRNYWEIIYFITSSGLAISAVLAFFLARSQLHSAENVRLASVYMEITKRWSTEEMALSRKLLTDLADFYERQRERPELQDFTSSAEYIRAVLVELIAHDKFALQKYLAIATFLEDVGVLCRKDYVRADDLFDFIGGAIVRYTKLLLPFMLSARQGPHGRSIYANAFWLYRRASQRRTYEETGEGLE